MTNTLPPSQWHLMYRDYADKPLPVPHEPVCASPEAALERARAFVQAHGERPTFSVVLRDGTEAEEESLGVFIRQIPDDPNEETLDWQIEHLQRAVADVADPLTDFLNHERMR